MSRMQHAEISGMRRNLVNTARYLAFPFFYNHFFWRGKALPYQRLVAEGNEESESPLQKSSR